MDKKKKAKQQQGKSNAIRNLWIGFGGLLVLIILSAMKLTITRTALSLQKCQTWQVCRQQPHKRVKIC